MEVREEGGVERKAREKYRRKAIIKEVELSKYGKS
jgi:hypothetical protein